MADKAWERYVDLVTGFTQVAQRRAEQVVRTLVRRGEIEASKSEKAVEDLLARVDQNRKAISSLVKSEMEDAVRRLGLAPQSDIDRLQAKIARLEAAVRGETAKKVVARKPSAAKKAVARKPKAEPEPAGAGEAPPSAGKPPPLAGEHPAAEAPEPRMEETEGEA